MDDTFNDLIGMTVEAAEEAVASRGISTIRVMAEDGEHFFGTCDWRLDRLDVGLTEGVISSIIGVG